MSKEDKLRKEFEKQISRLDTESTKHKKLYRLLRYTALGLTGLATVLASAALTFAGIQDWLNIAIVVVTASAGVITSIEGLRKPAELWIHERNILYQLKDLLRKMDYEVEETEAITDIDSYFNQLQQILGASQEKWAGYVMPTSQTQTKQ